MIAGTCERADWSEFGFTTGMAAVAAAMAAAHLILTGAGLREVEVETPDTERCLAIEIDEIVSTPGGAAARVIKRAGPDRDITNGLTIEAEVKPTKTGVVTVEGGQGVGRVTLPGLAAPVGRAAINPVPLAHIKKVVARQLMSGAEVIISAIGGADVALKTFNPRLGIEGGISILGTSGLVRPMSAVAWRASLLPQLDQAMAMGYRAVVLTPGNLGAQAARSRGVPKMAIAQMGNFPGFMLRGAVERGLDPLIIGHLGKVVKIAAGYEDTHHGRTRDRVVLLAEIIAQTEPGLAAPIGRAVSAEAAITILLETDNKLLNMIAGRAARRAAQMAGRDVGVAITDLAGHVVGIETKASSMLDSSW